jgi:tetratricopeptide (TPR) repeat protein
MDEQERIRKGAEELYNQASIAHQKDELQKANRLYEKLIKAYPPNAGYYLAYILFLFDEDWTIENAGDNYYVIMEVCRNAIKNVPVAEHYYFYVYQAKAIGEFIDYSGEMLSNEEISQIPVLYEKAISLYPDINEAYIYICYLIL